MITGAASGIARRTAEVFAKEGAQVMIADRDEERGRRLAAAPGAILSTEGVIDLIKDCHPGAGP